MAIRRVFDDDTGVNHAQAYSRIATIQYSYAHPTSGLTALVDVETFADEAARTGGLRPVSREQLIVQDVPAIEEVIEVIGVAEVLDDDGVTVLTDAVEAVAPVEGVAAVTSYADFFSDGQMTHAYGLWPGMIG